MNPLAIDLFCGLTEVQLFRRTDSAVQQFMAGRTQNPDHVRFGVFHFSPCSVSAVFRSMCQFNNSTFPTGLTSGRQIGEFSAQSNNHTGILEFPSGIVGFLYSRILTMKRAPLFLRRLATAVVGTIAPIAIRGNNIKVLTAYAAVSSCAGDVALFTPPKSACPRLAFNRAIALVWTLRLEVDTTHRTEQFIHL